MQRFRIIFSGSGGQGIITASIIFAETAVLYEKLNAVQTQTYGAQARGGATRSEVIISDSAIYFPKVIQPNILVCLTQESYNKYYTLIRPNGLLITDSNYVEIQKRVDARHKQLPMYKYVMENIGNPSVANVCMLGALQTLTNIVNMESLIKVLETRTPANFFEMNKKALDLGVQLAQKVKD